VNRALLLIATAAACSSAEERSRQAAEFREARDAVKSAEVVKALQSPVSAGRLIYERPADLSYDSLLVKRPELARASDRRSR
jgi:hypothetical protein